MSKLGKKPIQIPKETNVKIETGKLILTGPKGSKTLSINDKIFSMHKIWSQLINNNELSGFESNINFLHVSTLDIYKKLNVK